MHFDCLHHQLFYGVLHKNLKDLFCLLFGVSNYTTTTTKTFFSVINKFTENICVQNISDNKDAINNNLAEW